MVYESVVIIGAPRSGTNMLRDMLVELPGVGTWPCDEINYIWRHGNLRNPSDEFTPEMATPKVQAYIREQFDNLANARNLDTVIEKTCANSLRVGFVGKILPEAKYVFIVRDGMDAVGSALQRWTASLDINYILQKARYVPPTDLPYYALRYLFHRMYRLLSKEKRLALWGPAMNNIDALLERYTLVEVCALQWKACVDQAERDFALISPEKIIKIKYEEFIRDPVAEFARLAEFLNKDVPDTVNEYLRKNVRLNSVGKGRKALGEAGVEKLRPLIVSTLVRYDYE
ncbi:MAG: sulfotransferase [Gammaproteobacteria bacterium]|nr:sulfotransferase [Gammaproteobacteria bacterium]